MGTEENLLIYETGGNNVLVAVSGVLIGRGSLFYKRDMSFKILRLRLEKHQKSTK